MWKKRSLATRIVILVAAAFSLTLILFFFAIKYVSHDALMNSEKEKAKLIVDTAAPLVAARMHLGQQDKVDALLRRIMENPEVLFVKMLRHRNVIAEERRSRAPADQGDYFAIQKEILDPIADEVVATLRIGYSNERYRDQSRLYDLSLLVVFEILALLVVLFTLYLRNLLKPLRRLTSKIQAYKPGQSLQLPSNLPHDEIGQINAALVDMNNRLSVYDNDQRDKKERLESEIVRKTEELQKLLYTDNLTLLPNRMKLLEDLTLRIDSVLIIANIDAFRQINDFYGQKAGDHIIKKVASILTHFSTQFAKMQSYRLSGDEFALFSQLPIDEETLEAFLITITDYFDDNPITFEEIEIDVHISLGATMRIDKGIEKADIALKSARNNRLPYQIYDEDLNVEGKYEANMQWLRRLKYAMANDNIVPYYQPIFDNQDHRIVNYECLMRMREKDGAILTPSLFLDVAKQSRLYTRLTQIMVRKCCEHFQPLDSLFSINLSAADIHDIPTRDFIVETVTSTNVGNRIIFEILESEGIENYDEVSEFIEQMKALGCRFAIDDFGAGHSNFQHLLRLKVDIIKIDGSLIENLDTSEHAVNIVDTIVEFTHKLGLICIAEFVHSSTVFDAVKRAGIDRSQGFYLGIPKPETF